MYRCKNISSNTGCITAPICNVDTLSITEVMYSSGFNDLANFSKQFRRCFGCSPREYRKRASEGPVQINGSPKNQI
ncbi:MAG: helix-turn-helix domain-containing protein [Clostridia bacterium]